MDAPALELEEFLHRTIGDLESRHAPLWSRRYSSTAEYEASVASQRQLWRRRLQGELDLPVLPAVPVVEEWLQEHGVDIRRVRQEVWPGVSAEGLLLTPTEGATRLPLVICLHGMQGCPENVAGITDPTGIYHVYGKSLAQRGFAVLAPKTISGTPARARLHRLAILLGTTLVGLEVAKIGALLDGLAGNEAVDARRIGMYGISQGGLTTLYATPLEQRVRCAVVCAYFNERTPKMTSATDKYLSFLDSDEEDKFVPGLLPQFSDSDLASLICPRPLLVQAGRNDRSIYWPEVQAEYRRAAVHYDRLGLGDRIELDLHEGGHEINLEGALGFLHEWLGGASV